MNMLGYLRDALCAANRRGDVLAAQLIKLELLDEMDRVAQLIMVAR